MNERAGISEMTVEELARLTESAEPIQILDIRMSESVERGHIAVREPTRFLAARRPGSRGMEGLDPDLQTVVVCDHGVSSRPVAAQLAASGLEVSSLQGGMAAWMQVLTPRALQPPEGFDLLIQFDRPGKRSLAYLLAYGGSGIVIDAPLEYSIIFEEARAAGVTITGVVDTHLHADYISGGPALSVVLGIPYHLHPADHADPFDGRPGRLGISPIREGDVIPVGGSGLLVRETPGHTEGSVTLEAGASAFTGDFLFMHSVGRPDLGGKAEAWTGLLWESLERVRGEWDPGLRILPGHYASEEDRASERSVQGRLADLLERIAPLNMDEEAAFRAWIGEREAPVPEAYPFIKRANAGLLELDARAIEELESGPNECAIR